MGGGWYIIIAVDNNKINNYINLYLIIIIIYFSTLKIKL